MCLHYRVGKVQSSLGQLMTRQKGQPQWLTSAAGSFGSFEHHFEAGLASHMLIDMPTKLQYCLAARHHIYCMLKGAFSKKKK